MTTEPSVTPASRVAITGGRDRTPTPTEMERFWELWHALGAEVLLHGAARGTDRTVAAEVEIEECKAIPFPVTADDGRWPSAGPRRNERMLRDGRAEALIAFPGGKGTAHCTRSARKLGLPVYAIEAPNPPAELV